MTRPRDIADLYLAPVVLKIDAELEALRGKTQDDVLTFIALTTNKEPFSLSERRAFFIEAVTRFHDMHGWVATCDPRGLRLTHGEHQLVLGLPAVVRSYLRLTDDVEATATA